MPVKDLLVKPPRKIHLDSFCYKIPGWVYFLTIVSNFKTPYFVKAGFNTEIVECFKREKEELGCKVYAYCLMPDHLHLLCGTTCQDISVLDFADQFKGKSTRIGWKYGVKGSLWQRRNYDHILRKEESLREVAEYILNNPVRCGLAGQWDKYAFCDYLDPFDP